MVWLRRNLAEVYPTLFETVLVPKIEELIATPYRFGGNKKAAEQHFVNGLGRAFQHMRVKCCTDSPFTVYYAFKQRESDEDEESGDEVTASTGWETMLEGLINSGFLIDGTWPMRTERGGGLRNLNQNVLASSIVLVCRPRPEDAPFTTGRDLISMLRRELPDALKKLQQGNIAPVDFAQAAIGPGMAGGSVYIDGESVLVKPDVALRQIEEERAREAVRVGAPSGAAQDGREAKTVPQPSGGGDPPTGAVVVEPPVRERKNCRFFGTVETDPLRLTRMPGRWHKKCCSI